MTATVRIRSGTLALALAALLALAGCGDDAPVAEPATAPPMAFDTARVLLVTASDTTALRVELALRAEQWNMGLMERPSLPDSAGMLFDFGEERPAGTGFWMFRTLIPLDIAFLDETGTIVGVATMQPCTSPEPRWCRTYSPGVPYHGALEVNAGFLQRAGVGVGDRVLRVAG